MAARAEEQECLNRTLASHLSTINDTIQVLDQTAVSSLDKVSWEDVVKMADLVSKQATITGMLWVGETPKAKAMEENMESYFNMLQGFLLVSHGSTVAAGPTLSSCIHASVKLVVDSSFKLMKESVSLFASSDRKDRKLSIPQLVGAVWEACSSLEKAPKTNIAAIGRGMTQVMVSIKDVLREMKELKQASSPDDDPAESECEPCDDIDTEEEDDDDDDDLGNDLSPEEMKVAQTAIMVVSDSLSVIKELICFISGFLKLKNPNGESNSVDSLEKLLKLCQNLSGEVDEIGACLYPPQEISVIKEATQKIQSVVAEMQMEVDELNGACEVFLEACNGLRSSVKQFASELSNFSIADLEVKVENIALSN